MQAQIDALGSDELKKQNGALQGEINELRGGAKQAYREQINVLSSEVGSHSVASVHTSTCSFLQGVYLVEGRLRRLHCKHALCYLDVSNSHRRSV